MAAADLTAARLREVLHYEPLTGVFTRRIDVVGAHGAVRFRAGEVAGCADARGYRKIGIAQCRYQAHRLAWLYMTGSWPAKNIDHIDGDGLNNRFANLRDVAQGVNVQNRQRVSARNATGLLGAYRSKLGYTTAKIVADGRRIYLGSFATAEEAHAAYLEAKRKLHEGCTI